LSELAMIHIHFNILFDCYMPISKIIHRRYNEIFKQIMLAQFVLNINGLPAGGN
jgi:hypothetical protein